MQIKWSVVFPAVMRMFVFYSRTRHESWTGEVMTIYNTYYRAVDREADAESKRDVKDAADDWSKFAAEAAFEPESRFDNKSLQVQGTDRSNRWVDKPQDLKSTDSIVSIVHTAREAPVVSRFQVVAKPQYAGQEFYDSLVSWVSTCSAVSQWKVMNPILGSSGPDSAVFYLNRPLSDGTVGSLVTEITVRLGEYLEELDRPPFGLMRLGKGIYGVDVPSSSDQRNKLAMSKDFGSAGYIISSIVCKAAMIAANDLNFSAKSGEHKEVAKRMGGEDEYAKAVLRNILAMDLKWELIE
jgi:hypothetical protein